MFAATGEGSVGDRGRPGLVGPAGTTGATGSSGLKGDMGFPGSPGAIGYTGKLNIKVRGNHLTIVGNHMPYGSHSVTCHPAVVIFPPLPQPKLVP